MAIDEEALRKAFADLKARVEALERASGKFVDDGDLDRDRGNPKVLFEPRDWRGPACKGLQFSQCSPEFLEMLAEALQWAGEHPKPDKERLAAGNLKDAARARSWARRIRQRGPAAAPANQTSAVVPARPPPPRRPNGAPATRQRQAGAAPASQQRAAPEPVDAWDDDNPFEQEIG